MKNKNGFTLIEVIAVVVILAIIILLGLGIYNSVYEKQVERTYQNKVSMIELAAEKWASEANISRNMTITVNKLVENSFFQADEYDSVNKVYIVNDPRDKSSMLCYTIDISIDNGEVVAKLNDVANCDLKDEETDKAKVEIAAYEYDVATKKITKVLKKKTDILTTTNWTKKAVLLAVEPKSEYSSYKRVMFSSNGVSKEKVVNNNVIKLSSLTKDSIVNADNYANLYVVDVNLFLKAVYNVAVDVKDIGIKSNEITVQIDKEAPTLNIIKDTKWTKGKKDVKLRGTDGAGSGLKGFYVTTIGSGYTPKAADFKSSDYEAVFSIANEGDYYAYAEDNVGNVSSAGIKFEVINIDATAPSCKIVASGSKGTEPWYNATVNFKLEYSDTESGVKSHEISSTTLTTDSSGYKVTAKVVDNVGNVCNDEITVKRDATAPTINVEVVDADKWKNTNKTVNINVTDATSGVIGYYIGSGSSCSGVTYIKHDGSTKLQKSVTYDNGNYIVCAKDNAGNISSKNFNVEKVDKVAPAKPSISNPTGGKWTKNNFKLTLTNSSTDIAYYQYTYSSSASQTGSDDGTQWVTYSDSAKTSFTTTEFSAERDQLVYVRTCDYAGNCSEKNSTYIRIDKTAPSCSGEWKGQSTEWKTGSRTITHSATDSASGTTDKYNNTFNKGTIQTQKVSYTAVDAAGNSAICENTVNIYIDNDAPAKPTITNPTSGNWTNSNFKLTLSTTSTDVSYYQYTYNSSASQTGSNDGTQWVTYSDSAKTSFTTSEFSAERNQLVYIRVCDRVNLCSEKNSTYIRIDKTPPTCTDLTGTSTTWTSSDRTISYGCRDSDSGCNSSFSGGSKPFTTTTKIATISSYTIKDNAGNSKTCDAKTANVYVDKDKPTIKFNLNDTSYTSTQSLVVTISDDHSGINNTTYEVYLDDTKQTIDASSYTNSSFKYSLNKSGTYKIVITSTDNAKNVNKIEKSFTLSLGIAASCSERNCYYCSTGWGWMCWTGGGCACSNGQTIAFANAGCDSGNVSPHDCGGTWARIDNCVDGEKTCSCPEGYTLNGEMCYPN